MELPKRDRGWVRTAKDIERKYDLGHISKMGRKFEKDSEKIDELLDANEELNIKYEELKGRVFQNEKSIMGVKEAMDEKIGDIELLLSKV